MILSGFGGQVGSVEVILGTTHNNKTDRRSTRDKDRLRFPPDTIPSPAISALPDGSVDFINQRWLEYLGLTLEDVRGWGWTVAIHPEDVEGFVTEWRAAIATGESIEKVARFRRSDGEYRRFLLRIDPLRDEQGCIIRWHGTRIDIEDRRQAEEKFKALLESAPDPMVIINAEGKILIVNSQTEKLFGYDRAELYGQTVEMLIPDRFRGRHLGHRADYVQKPKTRAMGAGLELYGLRKDGTEFPIDISLSPLNTEEGVIVTAAIRDITERRRAEKMLQESEERFREMADKIPEVIWFSALEPEKVLYVSPSFEHIWGLPVEDLYRNPRLWTETIHPEDRDRIIDIFSRWIAGEKIDYHNIEYRIVQPNGAIRWIHDRGVLSFNEAGKPYRASGISTDITERKRAESRLNTQYAITCILSESASIDEATPRIVQSICECLDWKVGEIWRMDGETKLLTFLKAWHLPSGDFEEFVSASLRFTFPPSVGLPGRVCESRKPLWIRNLAEDSNFPRISLATKAGLHCGFGFPILLGEEALGALVFFSREVRELDHDVLQMMASIGSQIGQFIERKRAEEELRRSEFYLSEGQRLGCMGTWVFNPAGFDYWSAELFRIYGLDPTGKAPTVQEYLDCVHPQDRDFMANLIKRILTEPSRFDTTKRIVRPDGEVRYIRCVGAPIVENGILRYFIGTAVDVTEHEQMTQELQHREMYLAEAQRLSHTGSFGWRVSTGEIIWSEETFQIFQYDKALKPTVELILQRVHPEDTAIVKESIERASQDRKDFDFEHRLLMPNGAIKYVHVVAHALSYESESIEFVGAVMDITAAREAEEKIRQNEREFRQIVEAIPALIAVLSPDGRVYYMNELSLLYTGLTLKSTQAENLFEQIFHPGDLEKFRHERQQGLSRGLPFKSEQRLRRNDGEYRWFVIHYNPVKDEKGRILRWYVTATDIDDRKQSEERTQNENIALREEVDKASMFEEIVGVSPALQAALARVTKVAPTDSTVLITGETGTGKELIARAIHKRSPRSTHAFVSVNCAAIPPSLLASELFGHEKGAFTGALQRRLGRFELAEGGTIFLDEIGDLPAETQIALLRVLQEHEFERVGGNQAIRANVRVIAATNRELKAAIEAGDFRSDLFYRLNVFPVEVPPLRTRQEDIPLLVEYFVDRYASKSGKRIRGIDKKTLALLQSYSWPGNIRELQNVIERSVILSETDNFSVDESWLSRETLPIPKASQQLSIKLITQEKEMIEAALTESRGRVSGSSGAAAKLGIPASTLESKIRSLKINKYRFKPV